MDVPQYKLEYFNLRGRAEPIRWILTYAAIPYEDVRFDREADWPKRRSETPYGKVPVLYADGKPLGQSVAICRYLGNRHNLATNDEWLKAVADEVADSVHDLLPHVAHIMKAKQANDSDTTKRLCAEFYSSTLPPIIKQLEARLEGSDYFCGNKVTWVDLFAACYLSQLNRLVPDAMSSTPKLKSLVDRVINMPQIKKWIAERPVTPM